MSAAIFPKMKDTATLMRPIEAAFSAGRYDDALTLVKKTRESVSEDSETAAVLHYLQGKIEMKQSRWTHAMSSFLKAEAINPEGPQKNAD